MSMYSLNLTKRTTTPCLYFLRSKGFLSDPPPPPLPPPAEDVPKGYKIIHGELYPICSQSAEDRPDEWYSKLKLFGEGPFVKPDFITAFHKAEKFNLNKWWADKQEEVEIMNQEFREERHNALGPDLATAHFICHRGGSIRFRGQTDWLSTNKDEDEKPPFPDSYKDGYVIEMINCENMHNKGLRYEGLNNLISLRGLKWLSLRGNAYIDDWGVDRLSCNTGSTLEYLDLSDCPISYRGLVALYKMEQLKVLILSSKLQSENTDLTCAMLEEINKNLLIKFV